MYTTTFSHAVFATNPCTFDGGSEKRESGVEEEERRMPLMPKADQYRQQTFPEELRLVTVLNLVRHIIQYQIAYSA